jgi:hypothetical protein
MLIVSTKIEKQRLNGYRIPGELYLVGTMAPFQCCQLPITLQNDIIPKRGIVPVPEQYLQSRLEDCREFKCPSAHKLEEMAGMMWVNEKYYPSAAHFFQECRTASVEMRIKRLHCGIKPGKSWILLAHRTAVVDYENGGCNGWVDQDGKGHSDVIYKPGIFGLFKVERIEFILRNNFPEVTTEVERKMIGTELETLVKMKEAGIEIVQVLRDDEMKLLEDYPDGPAELTEG